jgi:hypothetical protein
VRTFVPLLTRAATSSWRGRLRCSESGLLCRPATACMHSKRDADCLACNRQRQQSVPQAVERYAYSLSIERHMDVTFATASEHACASEGVHPAAGGALRPDDRSTLSCLHRVDAVMPRRLLSPDRQAAPCRHVIMVKLRPWRIALDQTSYAQLQAGDGDTSRYWNGQQGRLTGCPATEDAVCCRCSGQRCLLQLAAAPTMQQPGGPFQSSGPGDEAWSRPRVSSIIPTSAGTGSASVVHRISHVALLIRSSEAAQHLVVASACAASQCHLHPAPCCADIMLRCLSAHCCHAKNEGKSQDAPGRLGSGRHSDFGMARESWVVVK